MVGGVGRGMGVLDGSHDRRRGRGSLGLNLNQNRTEQETAVFPRNLPKLTVSEDLGTVTTLLPTLSLYTLDLITTATMPI